MPGLTVGPQKVSGSRLILRALDGLVPDPPLVPSDPELRAAVDEADLWGDDVLQDQVRWIAVDAIRREPSVALDYGSKSAPPLPAGAIPGATKALFTTEMKLLGQPPERVRDEYVPALAGHLDHVDALIADGVLGGRPGERGRLPGGGQHPAAPNVRGPARGHRRAAVRTAGAAAVPRVRRQHAAWRDRLAAVIAGDTKAVLFAAGLMFLYALLLGVLKFRQMAASPEGRAHPYTDTAHRAALLYAFAIGLTAAFVQFSGFSQLVDLVAAAALVLFFLAAVVGYNVQGLRRRDRQPVPRRRRAARACTASCGC